MFDGVKTNNPLLPILDQHWVVDKIIDGVLTNTEEIYLPKATYLNFLGRILLPSTHRDILLSLFGLSENMDSFKGLRRITK
jgi:hypothetical protein